MRRPAKRARSPGAVDDDGWLVTLGEGATPEQRAMIMIMDRMSKLEEEHSERL